MDLLRYGRTSHEVTEGFVRAVGDVGDVAIEARDVFWQRFRPVTVGPKAVRPSGVVILMVPGLAETGRHFLDQIYACNRLGHDVVVMDPQWAGQTRSVDGNPTPGEFDRGFGVARDIGRVAEYVHRNINHGQGGAPLVLLGQGCGATGILMMQVLQAAKKLKLDVPITCDAVLQAPYLSAQTQLRQPVFGAVGPCARRQQSIGLVVLAEPHRRCGGFAQICGGAATRAGSSPGGCTAAAITRSANHLVAA